MRSISDLLFPICDWDAGRQPSPKRKQGRNPNPDRKGGIRPSTDKQTAACPWHPAHGTRGPNRKSQIKNRKSAPAALLLCALLLPLGCGEQPPAEPESLTTTAERGPLKFTVEVAPKSAWVGDPLTISLTVETPKDYVVQLPTDEDAFGGLTVRNIDTSDPRPHPAGGLQWHQTVVADSYVSGDVQIPPLVAKYAHKPADPAEEPVFENELVTDPLSIAVRSALTSQDTVFTPRDITGPLAPPKEPLSPWLIAGVSAAAVLVLAAVIFGIIALRRRALRPPPPILPEVWALRELAALEAAELIGRGEAKTFYYRLSEIARVYIERKFDLAAPEMTTEEFLTMLARDHGAVPYDADRLRAFLEACDLVKYAALTPRAEDAETALGTARAFVDATAAAPSVSNEKGGRAA